MLDRLSSALNFYTKALDLRAERNTVLASNVANADTPNYKARDFDFKSALDAAVAGEQQTQHTSGGLSLARTNPRHLAGSAPAVVTGGPTLAYRVPDQPSLDGNTVDMNNERVQFMDNALHYQADLKILGDQIKSLKQAMQPAT